MTRYLPVILIASVGIALTSCQTTRPEEENASRYRNGTTGYLPETAPLPQTSPTRKIETSHTVVENVPPVQVETAPTPIPTPAVQDYPTAVPVEGKPGFVKSQNGSGIVDVRGYPPGTEVTDPYSGKVFLVP